MGMYDRFLQKHPNLNVVDRATEDQLRKYEGFLPTEMLLFWQEFGFGTFMNGYLKVVNPESYQGFMLSSYEVFMEPAIVIGATAFADLIIWEGDCVKQINYRKGSTEIHGDRITDFFNLILARWDIVAETMDAAQFNPALQRLGECAYDECYAYVPALALGGSEKVENLEKVKLREHISILSQLVGVIE
jgi:hypothetical protein